MKLKWGDGMTGNGGIEGMWKKLSEGTASAAHENIVFRL